MVTAHVNHTPSVAVLLVDVINHFNFDDGQKLLKGALAIAPNIARLKDRARTAGIPVIYVNDNFGQWQSQASELLNFCLGENAKGREFVEQIKPGKEDYFVLKPMNSAFYQSPLEALLRHLGATSVILAGIATNSCIVYTAHDAHMRDIDVIVATDCCAARSRKEHCQALEHIETMASARLTTADKLRLRKFAKNRFRSKHPND